MPAQATASVTAQNFLQPADDLGFRVDYKHSYLWGAADPNKTALNATAFNSRKLSGVFTPGALAALFSLSRASRILFAARRTVSPWFPSTRRAKRTLQGFQPA